MYNGHNFRGHWQQITELGDVRIYHGNKKHLSPVS